MELFFDPKRYRVFGDARDNAYFIIGKSPISMVVAVGLYLTTLSVVKIYMRNRPAYNLATPIRIYNLILVLSNIYLISIVWHEFDWGPKFFQCYPRYHKKLAACAFIADIFLCTRLAEFIETIFFALRKKDNQISFLHVFHHSYVPLNGHLMLIYEVNPFVVFFAYVNSCVHVVMYTYYFLATFKSLQPYLWWKRYLTQLQMLQFALIMYSSVWGLLSLQSCSYFPKGTLLINLMSAVIFMALFLQFFIHSYIKGSPSTTNVPAIKEQKSQ